MKKFLLTIMALFGFLSVNQIKAQDFFDTSNCEKLFTFGARVGFNTSNRTFPVGNYYNYLLANWGLGFNVGGVVNMNLKEYLAIQPGFFFETRSGNLVNIVNYYVEDYNSVTGMTSITQKTHYEVNKLRGYYITVPVMGVVKFNIAERIKWMVEAGPYFRFKLSESGESDVQLVSGNSYDDSYKSYVAKAKGFDMGFKLGTSLLFWDHYYAGVHYMAGATNAWSLPSGGRNKSWMFTVGYDF